jgi:Predicted transcriptional regulators
MNLTTISDVSKKMSISTRTLRYYEQIGLIESAKKDDYAYRTYDEDAVSQLHQILVLRKLRIPLKQIAMILKSENTAALIEAFQQNLNEVDEEITALSTIRNIINAFITRLKDSIHQDIKLHLLDDTTLLEAVDALTVQKPSLKEEKTAAELQAASEKLNKLTDRDVRIVYLPPATVASAHIIGGNAPELETDEILEKFIIRSNLLEIKPDLRHYGFNSPNGSNDGMPTDDHGYERWITIPDKMVVSAPLSKKCFPGGLYAAHGIMLGEWDRWSLLWQWIETSARFDFNLDRTAGMDGMMEEHINPHHYFQWRKSPDAYKDPSAILQIDLLIPIKERE